MDPVEEQLVACNAKDIECFIAANSPEGVIEDGEGKLLEKGSDQIREMYRSLFASNLHLHCWIVNRIKNGNFTVDEEEITGVTVFPAPLHGGIIYSVEGDKVMHERMLM